MRYVPKWNCKACNAELTDHEQAYSYGVCPKCGAVSDGSFVDCHKSSKPIEDTVPRPSLLKRFLFS